MSWTDERVDTLKRLWGEGLSASQIATQLGGVSRNAVIGKVHRLGLESRIKKDGDPTTTSAATPAMPDGEADVAETARAEAEPVDETASGTVGATETTAFDDEAAAAPVADNDPGAPAPDVEPGEDEVVVPVPLKLKLTQLTERTCKWPVGDPMHDDFHFCGHDAEEGRPYCEYHSGLAFQPASERRRVR